jgi:hypothetical protein
MRMIPVWDGAMGTQRRILDSKLWHDQAAISELSSADSDQKMASLLIFK